MEAQAIYHHLTSLVYLILYHLHCRHLDIHYTSAPMMKEINKQQQKQRFIGKSCKKNFVLNHGINLNSEVQGRVA